MRRENEAHMSNKATTSSVETNDSISGCICLSMNNLRRGKMFMGPMGLNVSPTNPNMSG